MEKKYQFWMGAACLMTGIVLGFMLAPVKKGLYCGNYNGNTYGGTDGECWDGEDEENWGDDAEDDISF